MPALFYLWGLIMIENKVISVDFDGTITKENLYPNIGEFRENAVECIKKLQEHNHVFLFTCRQGKTLVSALRALEEKGVQLPIFSPYDVDIAFGRKPIADYYIDDRAMFDKEPDWYEIEKFFMGGKIENAF